MIFIIDTNIVFSGMIKDGKTRELLIDSPFILYAPETMISEIRKYRNLIMKKSGFTKDEFETLFSLLIEEIIIIEKENYGKHLGEAEKIMENIDKKDAPFVALALSISNDGIWSDDSDFDKQNKIKIWKTAELLKKVNSSV